jgi:hypothetical protein
MNIGAVYAHPLENSFIFATTPEKTGDQDSNLGY